MQGEGGKEKITDNRCTELNIVQFIVHDRCEIIIVELV